MSALIDSNPEYAAVKLIRADWDKHGKSGLRKELKIPRRSTLLMFKGGEEVARVVAQTDKQVIEDLFKSVI